LVAIGTQLNYRFLFLVLATGRNLATIQDKHLSAGYLEVLVREILGSFSNFIEHLPRILVREKQVRFVCELLYADCLLPEYGVEVEWERIGG